MAGDIKIQFLKVREQNIYDIRLWRMSEDVTRYMYTDPQITTESQRKWYQSIVANVSRMDWVISVDGEKVGFVGLYDINPINRRCFWAYYLGEPSIRGKGIGKAVELDILNFVFERLNFHKLYCELFEWNTVAIRAHEKLGSKIEGVFCEHIYKRDAYHDVVRMVILRQRWNKIKYKFQIPAAEIEEWEDKMRFLDIEGRS